MPRITPLKQLAPSLLTSISAYTVQTTTRSFTKTTRCYTAGAGRAMALEATGNLLPLPPTDHNRKPPTATSPTKPQEPISTGHGLMSHTFSPILHHMYRYCMETCIVGDRIMYACLLHIMGCSATGSCAVWGRKLAQKVALFHCDNTGVVAAVKKGSAREPLVMHLLCSLWFFVAYYDIYAAIFPL